MCRYFKYQNGRIKRLISYSIQLPLSKKRTAKETFLSNDRKERTAFADEYLRRDPRQTTADVNLIMIKVLLL